MDTAVKRTRRDVPDEGLGLGTSNIALSFQGVEEPTPFVWYKFSKVVIAVNIKNIV